MPNDKKCEGECGRIKPLAEFYSVVIEGFTYHQKKCRPCCQKRRNLRHYNAAGYTLGTA